MNKELKPLDNNKDKLLNKILDNQTQELTIKAQEIDVQREDNKNSLEFAKASLKARSEESTKNLEHREHIVSMRYWFAGAFIAIISGLLAYALATDNNAFALEIIKSIIFFSAGALAGYQPAKKNNP